MIEESTKVNIHFHKIVFFFVIAIIFYIHENHYFKLKKLTARYM